MIRHALPELNFSSKQIGFLDLCSLWKHIDKFPKFKFPYEGKISRLINCYAMDLVHVVVLTVPWSEVGSDESVSPTFTN